jgi:acid phosphatase (class A)
MKSLNGPLCYFRLAGLAGLIWLAGVPSLSQAADDLMDQPVKTAKTAQLHYLSADRPDATALLAPPPLPDSGEQAADLAETVTVHSRLTPREREAAKAEKKFSMFAFAPAVGPLFRPENLPKTQKFLKHVQEDTEAVTDTAKNFWKRPRPYVTDPELARGSDDLEKSFSYPSGHSTRGTVFALVLADLFPDKKEQILQTGRAIGWHRVELGRHYPTDIYAGRVLAQAIVREMKNSPEFLKDFANARNEIASVALAEKQKETPLVLLAH